MHAMEIGVAYFARVVSYAYKMFMKLTAGINFECLFDAVDAVVE